MSGVGVVEYRRRKERSGKDRQEKYTDRKKRSTIGIRRSLKLLGN
jgi:hypothetical protein